MTYLTKKRRQLYRIIGVIMIFGILLGTIAPILTLFGGGPVQ